MRHYSKHCKMKREKLLIGIFTENRSIPASILAALAQDYGWEVDIEFIPPQAALTLIQERIAETKPDLFALSFRSYERKQAFEVASVVKKMGVKIIAGGHHPTLLPQDLVQCGFFDAIVQGDGMGVLKQVLDEYKSFENCQIIKGQRHHDKTVYSRRFFSASQQTLLKSTRSATMISSIGCPFSCKYCGSSRLDYFVLPEHDIVNSIVEIVRNFNVSIFTFHDDLFCANPKRIRRISSLLEEKFPSLEIGYGKSVNARASDFNDKIAAELVRQKVTDVSFGIESASPKLLKFLGKQQSQEDCYRAIELCHKFGLYSRVNLMFGIPNQDREDYELTLQFVKNSQPNIVNLFYFTPFPGTDLYDYCFEHGYLPDMYDRNKFDWFDLSLNGIRDIQCQLKKVDYDMARDYIKRIENLFDSGDHLKLSLDEVDQSPWVLLGSSNHIYFSQVLEHIIKCQVKNCLGYWDIDTGAAYSLAKRVEYHEYFPDIDKPPICFVTYCHITSRDYQNFKSLIDKKFGNLPLISISSLKRHTIEEIRQMIQGSAKD